MSDRGPSAGGASRPFADLTAGGQARRLRQMASRALARYDLRGPRLSLVDNGFNGIFRVDTDDSRRYALRINSPAHRTLTEIRSEVWWLRALSRETELTVPEPISMRDGDLVGTVEVDGVPQPRHHVVFRWLDGRNVRRPPTPALAAELGYLMARLHDHADTFVPPPEFSATRRDRAWPFGVPGAVYADDEDARFPPPRRAVLREAAARVEAALAELYADPDGLRFLHFDLHQGNVKVDRGRLWPLDFDDCRWGYPVQDIAVSLFYLERNSLRADPHDAALRAAFARGYTRRRPWPERYTGQLDTFVVAHFLDSLNFALLSDQPYFREILPGVLARTEDRLRGWLA
jgi:Ser/Thr protein kinase RdoA (MazF antagonist)